MIPAKQIWPDDFAARYRSAGYWRGETFGGFLRERAQAFPTRTAIVGGDTRWSYSELDALADRVAAGFLQLGFAPGDRVVVQLPNIPAFFSVVFGLFRAGLIPVYALPAHRIVEITHFARQSEAVGYIMPGRHDGYDYLGLAEKLRAELPAVRHVIVAGGEAGSFTALDDVLSADGESSAPLPQPRPSDVAFLQISGGSTGLSKLIPRTHDDYIYSFRASAEICGQDETSVYLAALPIAHNFPMSSPGIFGTLYAGGRIVLSPSPAPAVAFPLIEREKATITGVVPPVALLWLDAIPNTKYDLSSLKILQVGGAKFTPEAARRVPSVMSATLQQVFGMAEGLVNYTRLDDPQDVIINTQGRPISADDEVLVVDDAGVPVPDGVAGHLLTRGPYTIRAYHNDPGANERSFTDDGYYRTGDIVVRRQDGNLVVHGRATDHINRAGEKISAEEIEDQLLTHPGVHDAAVVSIPDQYLGERTCAFLIARGTPPKPAEIKVWVRGRGLADFKVPDQIVFVESFSATAVGKISRKELRAQLRSRLVDDQDRTS